MRFNQTSMYIVIFKAKIKQLDSTYSEMAQKLRNRALSQFNCAKFEACSENGFEIALDMKLSCPVGLVFNNIYVRLKGTVGSNIRCHDRDDSKSLHYYLPSTSTKQICKKAVGAVGDGDNGALKELNKL